MGRNRRRDKLEVMQDKLQLEHTRLLIYIDEAAEAIEGLSAGQIYSPNGAKAVQRLDALTSAEDRLSEAIMYLEQAVSPKIEERKAN